MEAAIAAILWLIFGIACLATILAVGFIAMVWYNLFKEFRKKDK